MLKIMIIANEVFTVFLCLIVRLAKMQVSMTNTKDDTSKIV